MVKANLHKLWNQGEQSAVDACLQPALLCLYQEEQHEQNSQPRTSWDVVTGFCYIIGTSPLTMHDFAITV